MGPAFVPLRPWRGKPNVHRQTPGGREGKGLSSAFMLCSLEPRNQITPSTPMEKREWGKSLGSLGKMPPHGILRSKQ